MKKLYLLSLIVLTLVLTGCLNDKVGQPLAVGDSLNFDQSLVINQQPAENVEIPSVFKPGDKAKVFPELINGPEDISQFDKIGDYYILQTEKIGERNIYLLAQNYKIEKVEAWFGAPTGITQTGTFYFYQGDINQFNQDKVVKIGDFNFTGRKIYSSLNQLKSSKYQNEHFVMIEQYEMNNFSRFYFWLVKADSITPVKFNDYNSVMSGWTFNSIEFNDLYITTYGYWGGQPFDYSETFDDWYWDGSNFELIMRKTIISKLEHKYSFFTSQDKQKPTWEVTWPFDSIIVDYFLTSDRNKLVYVETVAGGDAIKIRNLKTGLEQPIISEPETVYEFINDKCTDKLIYYAATGFDSPPFEYQYNLETGEIIYTHNLDQYFERFKF